MQISYGQENYPKTDREGRRTETDILALCFVLLVKCLTYIPYDGL
jgi:hypothetical protein